MNKWSSYDIAALRAIQRYHEKHGEYPKQIEATAGYRSKMSQSYFECVASILDSPIIATRVPVVAIGTCDIVFRGILIKNTDINLEKAECATAEQFQRIGAKFARAGCLIMGEKSSWGLQTYNPHLFFSQIEAFVFGEERVLEEVMPEKFNQLPGD